jgi:predicted Rossmann fold flavoprotein
MRYDLIVVGSGAAGMMAAIRAADLGRRVLLLEKLPQLGAKLKATGGGRCNLTNTLDNETFMSRFGREGRFMGSALEALDAHALRAFFERIGVPSHAPDGFRVFPLTHSSQTIINALTEEMHRAGVEALCRQKAELLLFENGHITGVKSQNQTYLAPHLIIATGGMGYPMLGAEGDGYRLAAQAGHQTTPLHPAMMPLQTKEHWVASCRADTIPKAHLVVNLKKYANLQAKGDLIFTKEGIRGPVVLDFSREITPLLAKLGEVPLLANLTGGMNEEQIRSHFKQEQSKNPQYNTLELLQTLLPASLASVFCTLTGADPALTLGKQQGIIRDQLIKYLAWMPLTITGHEGFKMAMITRGGIPLREIDPLTMQSRLLKGLYFCGEVMNLDGPCGGYNLQWSFSSGYLAGELKG